jgi:hypothetical protein
VDEQAHEEDDDDHSEHEYPDSTAASATFVSTGRPRRWRPLARVLGERRHVLVSRRFLLRVVDDGARPPAVRAPEPRPACRSGECHGLVGQCPAAKKRRTPAPLGRRKWGSGNGATRTRVPGRPSESERKPFDAKAPSNRRGRDGVAWPILGDCGSLDPGSKRCGVHPRTVRLSVPALPARPPGSGRRATGRRGSLSRSLPPEEPREHLR